MKFAIISLIAAAGAIMIRSEKKTKGDCTGDFVESEDTDHTHEHSNGCWYADAELAQKKTKVWIKLFYLWVIFKNLLQT